MFNRRVLRAIEEELRLSREQRAEQREFMGEQREFMEDQREFMRECLLRMDRIFERHARAIDDMRDQVRANTEATWRMLDRFDRLDPGGAAGAT